MSNIEMVVHSITTALIDYRKAVVLKEKYGQRCLPMWVSSVDADIIARSLHESQLSKPFVDSFVVSVIKALGATLMYTVMAGGDGDTYKAKVFLERDGKPIEIDCWPSDALAVSGTAGVPIFVTEEILSKMGVVIDQTLQT